MKNPQEERRSAPVRNKPWATGIPSRTAGADLPISSHWQGGAGTYDSIHSQYRAIALQMLYEHETTNHIPSRIFHLRMYSLRQDGIAITGPGEDFIRRLVFGVFDHQDELDGRIGQAAQRYPVHTLLVIDRNILRMALYEIEAKEFHSPARVVISEAIHLADAYGSEASPHFVHGVLGAILQHQEPAPVSV